AALLKDPELLILDEPTNGLDPKGMAEMRELIRSLGSGQRTVILSSHLLAEVEQVCDRVGIISRGRMVAEGPMAELRGGSRLVVDAAPLDTARQVCVERCGPDAVRDVDGVLEVVIDPDDVPALNVALVAAGVGVRELRRRQESLEAAFLALTQEGPEEAS